MIETAQSRPSSRRELIAPAVDALRHVWVPFVLILLCALIFVCSYYAFEAVRLSCQSIAQLKAQFGYGFSAVGGFCAGCVIPELFKRITLPGHRIIGRLGEIVLDSFYFIFMAVLCDGLYRFLGHLLGDEPTLRTVAAKAFIDQFIFTPTLGVGIAAVYFPLRKARWEFSAVFGRFDRGWYRRVVMPILLPAWCYWIPMVCLIYSLPALLQMPFSLYATAAWSLLLVVIARRERIEHAREFTAIPAVTLGRF